MASYQSESTTRGYGNTPLMENRNHPSGKPQAIRGLVSLMDKGTDNKPNPPYPPFPYTELT